MFFGQKSLFCKFLIVLFVIRPRKIKKKNSSHETSQTSAQWVYELLVLQTETDTFVKTVLSDSGVSKRKDLMKIPKVIFHIKPIPSHIMRIKKLYLKYKFVMVSGAFYMKDCSHVIDFLYFWLFCSDWDT